MKFFSFGRKKSSPAPASRPAVSIAESVINVSEQLLRRGGKKESIVYWAGIETSDAWLVTTVIAPKAVTTWGSYETSTTSNANVISFLSEHRIILLAQVHTHPGEFVGHSDGDDHGAFMAFENFLSVIIPNYCWDGILPLNQCGVHRFENGIFRRLSTTEIERTFRIIPLKGDLQS